MTELILVGDEEETIMVKRERGRRKAAAATTKSVRSVVIIVQIDGEKVVEIEVVIHGGGERDKEEVKQAGEERENK